MRRDKPILITLSTPNGRITCITQTCGVLSYYVQHRLNVSRRAGDDTQYVARSSLLLQRFFEFLKQPSVLYCNYRLVCKGLKRSDLSIVEGFHLLSPNYNSSNDISFAHERCCKDGTRTGGI